MSGGHQESAKSETPPHQAVVEMLAATAVGKEVRPWGSGRSCRGLLLSVLRRATEAELTVKGKVNLNGDSCSSESEACACE